MSKCCKYNAGQLREPVEFQKLIDFDVGGGATEQKFVEKFRARGHVKPLSGGERLYAERLDAQTRNRLVIRYREDVTESDRVVIRGRAYQIRFIANVEFRNRWLEIDLDGGAAGQDALTISDLTGSDWDGIFPEAEEKSGVIDRATNEEWPQ